MSFRHPHARRVSRTFWFGNYFDIKSTLAVSKTFYIVIFRRGGVVTTERYFFGRGKTKLLRL